MLPKREIKDIYISTEASDKILRGVNLADSVVGTSYGPLGENVIIGMPFGDPSQTRDGVTIIKRLVAKDKAEDDAVSILRQASEKTNRSAGDGTTATVVLGAALYRNGHSLKAAGESGMTLKRRIAEDSKVVIDFLKKNAVSVTDDHLLSVATVSAGDPAIGKLVAKTLIEVGGSGGITIREQNYPTIDVEDVKGYYFDRGFFALNQPIEFAKPVIFVSQKQMASNQDIIPLLSRVINGDNKNLVIVGDVRMNSDAMNTLLLNVTQGKLNAVVIPPPAYNEESLLFMQDIGLYVGAKPFLIGDDIKQAVTDDKYFGTAERVQVTQDKAIIFGSKADTEENNVRLDAIEERANEIKEQITNAKQSYHKDQLEQRFSKLNGKIAIVNVGGSTPTEMEELRYRVEDAIEATRSAMADGVLPGGGTMLVRASELNISDLFKKSLLDAFRRLMNNADQPADYRIEQIKHAKEGFGFNLRDITDEPIDLREAGVFDAARAVIQTVENATSAAGSLLTTGAIIDPVERDEIPQQPQQ